MKTFWKPSNFTFKTSEILIFWVETVFYCLWPLKRVFKKKKSFHFITHLRLTAHKKGAKSIFDSGRDFFRFCLIFTQRLKALIKIAILITALYKFHYYYYYYYYYHYYYYYYLINRFIIWCNWSKMIIRVDKCSTFGIRKLWTKICPIFTQTVDQWSSNSLCGNGWIISLLRSLLWLQHV